MMYVEEKSEKCIEDDNVCLIWSRLLRLLYASKGISVKLGKKPATKPI